MATTTYVPIETHQRTVCEHDCEYVDGGIEERSEVGFGYQTGKLEEATVLSLPTLGVTCTLDESLPLSTELPKRLR